MAARNQQIIRPHVKNFKKFVNYVTPDNDCNADLFAQCLIDNQVPPEMAYQSWCAEAYDCVPDVANPEKDWSQFEAKFNARQQRAERALNQLGYEIANDFQTAYQNEQQSFDTIGQKYAEKDAALMKDWGCDAACVDQCAADWRTIDFCAMQQCYCPEPWVINYNATTTAEALTKFNLQLAET